DAGGDLLRKTERPSMRRKRGGAGGRARSGSSFIGQPGAKFPCEEAKMRMKKEKRNKKERTGGLWKLTPRMEIRKGRGFPPRLEKDLANHARLYHRSHRPGDWYLHITFFRQRSTLASPIFCPNNGEHLHHLVPLLAGRLILFGIFDEFEDSAHFVPGGPVILRELRLNHHSRIILIRNDEIRRLRQSSNFLRSLCFTKSNPRVIQNAFDSGF